MIERLALFARVSLRKPAFVETEAGMGGLAFGNRSKARRCIDIEDGYFDQPVTHWCGRSAQDLLIDPEEAGKCAPVIVIQLARRAALDELLDVGRVASDHPRDRGISEPSLLDQAIELLSDMFHRVVPSDGLRREGNLLDSMEPSY